MSNGVTAALTAKVKDYLLGGGYNGSLVPDYYQSPADAIHAAKPIPISGPEPEDPTPQMAAAMLREVKGLWKGDVFEEVHESEVPGLSPEKKFSAKWVFTEKEIDVDATKPGEIPPEVKTSPLTYIKARLTAAAWTLRNAIMARSSPTGSVL